MRHCSSGDRDIAVRKERNAGQGYVVWLAVSYWDHPSCLSNGVSYGPSWRGRRTPIAQGAAGTARAEPEGTLFEFLKSIAVEGFIDSTFNRRTS
jgi:hypothetical protein